MLNKLFVFALLLIHSVIFAQTQLTISGKVTDKTNRALSFANVALLNSNDSTLIKGIATDTEGIFLLNPEHSVLNGGYLLKISYLGYADYFKNLIISNQSLALGTLVLTENSTTLKTVNITDVTPQSIIKNDTVQYNSSAFKTNTDATTEDLVTKIPGITVQGGQVQAQGENVNKILVDGKPYFGDDANAALKNIPAEVIDKIQVFDEKSEQSKFTGFDDGNTSKTINIVTKPQFRNGIFGKAQAGYGNDDRPAYAEASAGKYKSSASANFFNNDRRLTVLGQSNNINEQNFSSEDLLGVMSSPGGGGGRQGGGGSGGQGGGFSGGGGPGGNQNNNANNFLVSPSNGISTTHAAGINYTDSLLGNKLYFTGSYFFNITDNKSISNLYRQYVLGNNKGLNYEQNNEAENDNMNHRLSMRIDYKIDSLNSILLQPKISVQQNKNGNVLSGENKENSVLISNTQNNFLSGISGINFSVPVLYRHKFNKQGRTFSLNVAPGFNQSTGKNSLNALNSFFADSLSADSLNQLANLNKQGLTSSSSASYTEPLNSKSGLQFTYSANYNKNISRKETFNFSSTENQYLLLDTLLTSKFASQYLSQSLGNSFLYQSEKINFTAGAWYQWARLNNEQQFPYPGTIDKKFYNILPNAILRYAFSRSKNLRVYYRTNNNVPAVEQLQNVLNNQNPLQLSIGNPDLKQDYRHNLFFRYSAANPEKSTTFFAMMGGTYANNYIGNSTLSAFNHTVINDIQLPQGSRLTKPVNLDGYYNLRSFINYGFLISKIKSNLNLNISANFTRTPSLINDRINYATAPSYSLGGVLSSNISKNIDFTVSSNSSYNAIENTLQKQLNSTFFNQTSKFKITLMPWKGLVFQTDLTHQYYAGLSANYNQNYLLWNGGVGYKFLKNNAAEIRFIVFDLLKQNKSISRTFTDSYIEDNKTIVLTRYYMLTFTYNLKLFKSQESLNDKQQYQNK